MVEVADYVKRARRLLDGNFSNRKTILIILACVAIFLYIIPNLFRILFLKPIMSSSEDYSAQRLYARLSTYAVHEKELDVHILYEPPADEKRFLPYVGNGYLGLSVDLDSQIFIRYGRSLSLAVPYRPIKLLNLDGWNLKEAIVSEYRTGTVIRYQFWDSIQFGLLEVSYQIYAHRSSPFLFIQDIKVTNPTDKDIFFEVEQLGKINWPSSTTETIKIEHGNAEHEYEVTTGTIPLVDSELVIPIAIITLKSPPSLQVKSRVTTTFHVTTVVNYSHPIKQEKYSASVKSLVKSGAVKSLKSTVTGDSNQIRHDHVSVWEKLWLSGFTISESKAANAVNGDLINATIYDVLSQVIPLGHVEINASIGGWGILGSCNARLAVKLHCAHVPAPLYEASTPSPRRDKLLKDLAYDEGCYGGPATLQADRLWTSLRSIEEVNRVVNVWLMTLEKQGCHQLIRAGADGVIQAMILSFGGLQFKNQHLEFNIDPQQLHRDYLFRRLNYGNATHLNISVHLQEEDYKAVIHTALDRSDKNYYACDAGCLDSIRQLGATPVMFPVKRTYPLTAILYITADKVHLEELKHTIHVQEIAIAPAHEHHVIALHRHGNRWGGLPKMFWLCIIVLIVVFHLFLFKLVFNEYCGSEVRVRYRKHSEF